MPEINIDKMIDDAMSLVGTETRWRHKGRDPRVGLDCIGLPRWLYVQQLGKLPDGLEAEFEAYHRRPDGQKLLATIRKWFDEVPREDIRKGDLIVIRDRSNPQHIAIACDAEFIVEAYARGRTMKIVYWKLGTIFREVSGVFRYPVTVERAALWQVDAGWTPEQFARLFPDLSDTERENILRGTT